MPKIYLSSFKPLGQKKKGRQVAGKFQLPYYIDGSCRREPDFEHDTPTITALCHGSVFAPRLKEGDKVVFITCQYTYPPFKRSHWRFVAVLKVEKRFESHEAAAEWFADNKKPLPSNCMVPGNDPLPFEKTHLEIIPDLKERGYTLETPHERIIKVWDLAYKERAKKNPVFLVCSADYLELFEPKPIYKEDLQAIFDGKVPGAQNPKGITSQQLDQLLLLTKTTENLPQ